MDKRLKHKPRHHKSTTGKQAAKFQIFHARNIFTDTYSKVREVKKKINKWEKSFCTAKENISKMKREPILWEIIFAHDTSDKGLISKI